ncbi:methionine ABC transporter ATP-binding protein [Ancylobacter sp. Lp-2]|uniref:methionine ABC transporter ATP-binding protein n=1 Tax=Ancylobacter sp. Lp-2 TaxID=2881339 RepID=UPI001E61AAA6|nr:methionine ABC transporter ATP-binding protein [Ancylobacter sp. Lp-2]MCB4768804.1 methionine ABC transporter ATP-binding protein [Ancylobacter sp. Lp-2]
MMLQNAAAPSFPPILFRDLAATAPMAAGEAFRAAGAPGKAPGNGQGRDGVAGGASIVLRNVSKTFPARGADAAVTALEDISLEIPRGEIYGVIGRSGAGKSTLIRTINGLERPTGGEVIVDGVVVNRLDDAALRAERRKIGMIFQHFNLLSSRSAFDNVALPLELSGLSRAAIRERVERLLDLVGLADKRDRYPVELSGGQKQRVGIARALATDPKVLLSDEATSALDPETTRSILALLARVNAELGVTIVLITHEMAVIKEICHRVGVIEAGRIIEEGPVAEVFAHPRTATARSFIGSLPGREIPAALAGRLRDDPAGATQSVLRLTLTGAAASQPLVTRLARELGIDIALLGGQIDSIGSLPFALLYVGVPTPAWASGAVGAALEAAGARTEVIGHVL